MKPLYKVLICLLAIITAYFFVLLYNNVENRLNNLPGERISDIDETIIIQLEDTQSNIKDTNILIEQIKNGDFTNLKESDDINIEIIERAYIGEKERDMIEWISYDLNKDGVSELIWQEKESYSKNVKRILGVFSIQPSEVVCKIWDINDMSEFYFLSKNGNIIYYTQYYGTYDYNGYECFNFDDECNMKLAYGLYIYNIYDFSEVDVSWWHEKHPDMLNEGVYYKEYIVKSDEKNSKEENLEEEDFLEALREMTGNSFYDLKPEWMID